MAVDTAPPNTRLCIVVEALAMNAQLWADMRGHLVEPLLRAYDASPSRNVLEVALVLFTCRAPLSLVPVQRSTWMSDISKFRQVLDEVSLTAWGSTEVALAEALGEAMYLFQCKSGAGALDTFSNHILLMTVCDVHRGRIPWPFPDDIPRWGSSMASFEDILRCLPSHRVNVSVVFPRTDQQVSSRNYKYFLICSAKEHQAAGRDPGKSVLQCCPTVGLMTHPQWSLPFSLFQVSRGERTGSANSSAAAGPRGAQAASPGAASQGTLVPGGGPALGHTPPVPSPMANDAWDGLPPPSPASHSGQKAAFRAAGLGGSVGSEGAQTGRPPSGLGGTGHGIPAGTRETYSSGVQQGQGQQQLQGGPGPPGKPAVLGNFPGQGASGVSLRSASPNAGPMDVSMSPATKAALSSRAAGGPQLHISAGGPAPLGPAASLGTHGSGSMGAPSPNSAAGQMHMQMQIQMRMQQQQQQQQQQYQQQAGGGLGGFPGQAAHGSHMGQSPGMMMPMGGMAGQGPGGMGLPAQATMQRGQGSHVAAQSPTGTGYGSGGVQMSRQAGGGVMPSSQPYQTMRMGGLAPGMMTAGQGNMQAIPMPQPTPLSQMQAPPVPPGGQASMAQPGMGVGAGGAARPPQQQAKPLSAPVWQGMIETSATATQQLGLGQTARFPVLLNAYQPGPPFTNLPRTLVISGFTDGDSFMSKHKGMDKSNMKRAEGRVMAELAPNSPERRMVEQLLVTRAREGRSGHNRLCGLIEVPGATFLFTVHTRPPSATPMVMLIGIPLMPVREEGLPPPIPAPRMPL